MCKLFVASSGSGEQKNLCGIVRQPSRVRKLCGRCFESKSVRKLCAGFQQAKAPPPPSNAVLKPTARKSRASWGQLDSLCRSPVLGRLARSNPLVAWRRAPCAVRRGLGLCAAALIRWSLARSWRDARRLCTLKSRKSSSGVSGGGLIFLLQRSPAFLAMLRAKDEIRRLLRLRRRCHNQANVIFEPLEP